MGLRGRILSRDQYFSTEAAISVDADFLTLQSKWVKTLRLSDTLNCVVLAPGGEYRSELRKVW